MDHAVTSNLHAEAYKLYDGKLEDALGGNPRTLSLKDSQSLVNTFTYKGYHWLNAARKASQAGNKSLRYEKRRRNAPNYQAIKICCYLELIRQDLNQRIL